MTASSWDGGGSGASHFSLSTWESLAEDVAANGGYAIVPLDEAQQQVVARGFDCGRRALTSIANASSSPSAEQLVRCIGPTEDSAHATGYHGAAGSANSMSRYNAHREGFIFSDGNMFSMQDNSSGDTSNNEFEPSMTTLQDCLHSVANRALQAIERQLELSEERWFQEQFQYEEDHSQWHLKRYVYDNVDIDNDCGHPLRSNNHHNNQNIKNDSHTGNQQNSPPSKETVEEQVRVLLPSHTDPSLLSVVILDQSGVQPGAMGLEVYQTLKGQNEPKRVWTELPCHGHGVAIIFIGSVLSHILGGTVCPSAKHRVVRQKEVEGSQHQERMAATFFLRPKGSAILQVPPSPLLEGHSLKKKHVTFDTWSSRVSRNYMKPTNQGGTKNGKNAQQQQQPPAQSNDYYRDDRSEVSLLGYNDPNNATTTKLTGREKYLGGEKGNNGKIYCIPGFAEQVLVIDPSTEPPIVKLIGPKFPGDFKWLRAVRMPSGIILGLPCHADSILRIDPATDQVSTIQWDSTDPKAPPNGMPWKYHGAGLSPIDNCLYCIPQFAETIMKIDPSETVSFFGGPFPGRNKWYGGLVGPKDGAIYGVCQNATGVLRIDPSTQTATLHGDFEAGNYKWHGGTLSPVDGCIYGIPAHADTVLKIEPGSPPRITTFGGPLRSGQHRSDGKYKFLGGACGVDGNVYFFPSDTDYVLQVNPTTGEVKEVGPNLRDLEPIHQVRA